MRSISYTLFNPTGNYTVLVHTPVPTKEQSGVAAQLMEREPLCEQVGFLSKNALRMAGGEFCGNASMCAAVHLVGDTLSLGEKTTVFLRVSGAEKPVEVRLEKNKTAFRASVVMPPVIHISTACFLLGEKPMCLPAVAFPGITHLIVTQPMARFTAEQVIAPWCRSLGVQALGLMLFDAESSFLTPLVYVPQADTMVWENSCASGTSAVGAYLAKARGKTVQKVLTEPGGRLLVKAEPSGQVELSGTVMIEKQKNVIVD